MLADTRGVAVDVGPVRQVCGRRSPHRPHLPGVGPVDVDHDLDGLAVVNLLEAKDVSVEKGAEIYGRRGRARLAQRNSQAR